MISKQLFRAIVFFSIILAHSQTISLSGQQFNNWQTDIDLSTTDNIYYTVNNISMTAGPIKFRENHDWDHSFGSGNFPVGIASSPGANIIVDADGIYNITYNRSNGVYTFTTATFPRISIIGQNIGTPWTTDVDLNTNDGINYNFSNFNLPTGAFKFRTEHSSIVEFGSAEGNDNFPSGQTIIGGGNITATLAGNFNINFNRNNGDYTFVQTLATSENNKNKLVLNTLVKDKIIFSQKIPELQILTLDARVISINENVEKLETSFLPNGQYIIKMKLNNGDIYSQRILKNQ